MVGHWRDGGGAGVVPLRSYHMIYSHINLNEVMTGADSGARGTLLCSSLVFPTQLEYPGFFTGFQDPKCMTHLNFGLAITTIMMI